MDILTKKRKAQELWISVKKKSYKVLKSSKKFFLNKYRKIHGYLKFYFHYYTLSRKNSLIQFFSTKIFSLFVLSIFYFLVVGIISFISGWYIDPVKISSETLTYFIAAAAMVGGIIALIFPFKMLIMQNAADNSSAGFYQTLGRDKRQDVVFFLMVFSVIFFFVLALTATTYQFSFLNVQHDLLRIIFQISIFIIGFNLYLVFLLFEMLFKRIDPFSAISLIHTSSIKYLDDIYARAIQFSNLMMMHPKTDKKTTKNEMLASIFQSFNNDLQYLSLRLNYLFDYHYKLLAKNESTASRAVLDVIASILNKYFLIRKDSSVLLPSNFFFVNSSDSQSFLTPHLESLVAAGGNYLKQEDAVGVKKIIALLQGLIFTAGEIKFVGPQTRDNPILMQCRGYLDQFVENIIQKSFLEGMYQAAIAYCGVGIFITRKRMTLELVHVYEMLNKISYAALVQKQDVVVSEVINTYVALINSLMDDNRLSEERISFILEHIQDLVLYGFLTHKSRSIPDNRMQQDLAKPYEHLTNLVIRKSESVESITDEEKKEEIKGMVIKVSREMRKSIRYLAEKMKNADHLLVGSLADVTRKIGCLLIDLTANPNWADAKRALEIEGKAYINQPSWFTDGVEQIDDTMSFDELPEAVSKMALVALDTNNDQIAEDATRILYGFAAEMLIKEHPRGYGYTEPRIMVLACYIGIVALKLKKTGILIKLKQQISMFEELYQKKYFSDPRADLLTSPKREQLIIEVEKLTRELRDLNRVRGLILDTEELLLPRITVKDVKEFIKEIWQVEIV
jgi:hypothetical protein